MDRIFSEISASISQKNDQSLYVFPFPMKSKSIKVVEKDSRAVFFFKCFTCYRVFVVVVVVVVVLWTGRSKMAPAAINTCQIL